jgi:hypothetical protein
MQSNKVDQNTEDTQFLKRVTDSLADVDKEQMKNVGRIIRTQEDLSVVYFAVK